MGRVVFVVLFTCACGSPSPAVDAGAVDAGWTDAGSLDGGSTDAGLPPPPHNIEARACGLLLGAWSVDAGVQRGFDAGGFSPCIPLPPLMHAVSVSQELGVWFASADVTWASDAGCQLALDYAFTTTNASETYSHAIHLLLDSVDAGLVGTGTYTLSGGSNCSVPLEAVGARSQ